ncbi:BON domain-containing protein [Massilia cavernae]|uniref:Osmotically-inducible protein Y n=1 Tax=Massilia cavernae TaxID=2320864 RepID=A0A418Y730_9BURK|nr:BON domain-containing protein [Massilia cavernae]RJG24751.1 BON domain-containing protein [Massilia cavernae]
MNRLKFVTPLLAALMLTTQLVGCASTSKQESVGEYIDDSVITAGVKAAILNEPTLKVSEINVETFKGVVQLSGFVSSADSVATASSVARSVKGVKSVKNDIRLK